MLPKLLAIVIATGSFVFYMAAFFVPEAHRKSDFVWSGVGLFYAVVLWFCAEQMGGAELLGQTASVALVSWLGWQTLLLRRTTTPPKQQTPLRFGSARTAKQRLTANSRPAIEYEFVEDGIADASDEAEIPPALTVDRVGTLVVPAAVVPAEELRQRPDPEQDPEPPSDPAVPSEISNAPAPRLMSDAPDEMPGDDADWGDADWGDDKEIGFNEDFVDAVAPKDTAGNGLLGGLRSLWGRKKVSQPMVELPSRPPSIPGVGKKKSQPMVELTPRPPSIPGLGKKKKSQPMVELPPRPRSIPRPELDGQSGQNQETEPQAASDELKADAASPPAEDRDTTSQDSVSQSIASVSAGPTPTSVAATPPTPDTMPAVIEDNEDSNWPDDEIEASEPAETSAPPSPMPVSSAAVVEDEEDSNWPDDEDGWI